MKVVFSFLLSLMVLLSSGQELNCVFSMDYTLVNTQEKQIFQDIEAAMYEFFNNRSWTEDNFLPEEKIQCYINLQFTNETDVVNGLFQATARIQSNRPVYGVDYETSVFDYVDKDFNFIYRQDENLNYSTNNYSGSLSSLLSFYAYMILGYDYNTFSLLGGQRHFETARDIANLAQQNLAGDPGWNALGDQYNRYRLVDQANNSQYDPVKEAYYTYHLKGLDILAKNRPEAVTAIYNCLKDVKKVKDSYSTSVFVQTFINSKQRELVNILKGAPDQEMKQNSVKLLEAIDPTNANKYQAIVD